MVSGCAPLATASLVTSCRPRVRDERGARVVPVPQPAAYAARDGQHVLQRAAQLLTTPATSVVR
jgi:hypothetical protein